MHSKKRQVYSLLVSMMVLLVVNMAGCGKKEIVSLKKTEMQTDEKATKKDVEKDAAKDAEKEKKVSEPKTIMVYVCGAVAAPGVYELSETSRIYEALEKAGGMTSSAATTYLNQAATLTDGEQIYVPTVEEVGSLASLPANQLQEGGTQENGKINLNTATKEELMTLPGIGDAKAESIIAYREEQGGFRSVEDIKQITGIKDGVFDKIKEAITI